MTTRTFILLSIAFVTLAWAGSAAIALSVAQTAEGPRGEQGEQGEPGPGGRRGVRGVSGPVGPPGTTADDVLLAFEGDIHPSVALKILARFWATQAVSDLLGEDVSTTHPQVEACLSFITEVEGLLNNSAADCGFFGVDE